MTWPLCPFKLTGPKPVFAQALVPVCQGYENLLPWIALLGPGLPLPDSSLPFELPAGYGALIVKNEHEWTKRDIFYEFAGDKWYFEGPSLDYMPETNGDWFLVFWSPNGTRGDYVAVIGPYEIWDPLDIMQAIIFTPMIRKGEELHLKCQVCPGIDDRVLPDGDKDGVGDLCDNCRKLFNPDQIDMDKDRWAFNSF